jgi:hypothetical protein
VQASGATNQGTVSYVLVAPSGRTPTKGAATVSGGGWSASFTFTAAETGSYEVRVSASSATASGFIAVPCSAPLLEFDPPCSASDTTQVRVTGRWFAPFDAAYVDFDADGSEEAGRIPVDNRGTWTVVMTIKPSSSPRNVAARDLSKNTARGTWSPCPPGTIPTTTTSTSTTTSTTEPTSETTTPTTAASTTSTTRPNLPGPDVTVPPSVPLPPATPGATLTVTPRLGPTGFVTGVTGTGFPANATVDLHWQPGVGSTTATTGADGTFHAQALIFPHDRLGPRALVGTSGGTTAYDAFLVVASTVQPSGQNVAQITWTRRFLQR